MDREIALWDGPAPGSESWDHDEVAVTSIPDAPGAVRNVVVPTLTSYGPYSGATRAVVVLPGGAFHLLSMENEGHDVARHLALGGISAHVLKYRVVPTPADDEGFHTALATAFVDGMEDAIAATLPLCIADAERAIERIRADGAQHVTLIGFSAGGRIAADLAITSPRDRRPDAVAAIYSPRPQADGAPPDAPPLFVTAAVDDPIVGVDGSLRLVELWRAAERPVELHLYERGGHGFGMRHQGLPVDRWADRFVDWLDSRAD